MRSKYSQMHSILSCCAALGCGVVETQSDAGVARSCPVSCPATSVGLVLDVVSTIDGGVLSGVEASFSDRPAEAMSCEPHDEMLTTCRWPSSVVASNATYSLFVTAPGFYPVNASIKVTLIPNDCCQWARFEHSTIALSPIHLASVDVSQLFNTSVLGCAPGYEHPNICCLGAPYKATVCTKDPNRPFGPCESGQFVYPDSNTCCSLDNATACVKGPNADATDAGPQSSCTNPCAPGAYPDPTDPSLCDYGVEGVLSQTTPPPCFGQCNATRPGYCTTQCPLGWAKPTGQNDLCCRADITGQILCYSQATLISGFSGGGGHGGANGFFGEQFFNDGNSYVTTCDFATSTCQCLLNGSVVQTPTASQFDASLLSICPFPVNP